MHHYTTSAYLSVAGPTFIRQRVWQHEIPKEAYKHDYLMHGLLALAALHLSFTLNSSQAKTSEDGSCLGSHGSDGAFVLDFENENEAKAYFGAAHQHYSTALTLSTPALASLNPSNGPALFILSGVLVTITFAFPLLSDEAWEPISSLFEIATLVRGGRSVHHALPSGPLASLLPEGFLDSEDDLPNDAVTALMDLKTYIQQSNQGIARKDAFLETIRTLERCLQNCQCGEEENRMVALSWLAMVPEGFIDLWKVKDPLAMVLLGYYSILLHGLRNLWWCGDWATRLLLAVTEDLGDGLSALVTWPVRKVASVRPWNDNNLHLRPLSTCHLMASDKDNPSLMTRHVP